MSVQCKDTNVDPNEVAKFDELARRWWDKNSEFKPLHDINPLRLDYINSKVDLSGKRILDVGCGGGILSESLARRGGIVSGIDMGDAALSVAHLHSMESGVSVDYMKITAEGLAKDSPASFDIITCMEMLEHVPDPCGVVRACSDLLKVGGHVFFSTISRTVKSWLFAIIGAEYVLKLLPKGTHQHKKFIRPSELVGFCRQAGLSLEDLVGMLYNPITKKYSLDHKDVNVNYLIHTRL